MEPKGLQNAVIYIYYERSSWHHLLHNFIEPFLSDLENKNKIAAWYFKLGCHRGEHIELFITQMSNSLEVIHDFEIALDSFLKEFPSINHPISYPVAGFFMNYPNNSFQITIQNCSDDSRKQTELIIQSCLSKSILTAIGFNEITPDQVFCFMIYLNVLIFKAKVSSLLEVGPASLIVLDQFQSILNRKRKLTVASDATTVELDFNQLYEQNNVYIRKVIQDIWFGKDPDLSCTADLQAMYCKILQLNIFEDPLFQICEMAFEQLNVSSTDQLMLLLLKLISRAFNSLDICSV